MVEEGDEERWREREMKRESQVTRKADEEGGR